MSLFGGQPPASQPGFASGFGAPAQSAASLFGAQSAPSLFGAPAQSPTGLFGAPAQQPSTSLFGAPAQSSASLFGAPAQTAASLFGAPAQSNPSLFGAPAQSAGSLFGAPAQSSSSLFGAPAQGTSLFGAPQQTSSSLFGAPAQGTSSLFGASAQQGKSLFGAPSQPGGSLFGGPAQSGGSLFGTGNQQQAGGLYNQQQQMQNMQPPMEITGVTRISHLPQNYQTDLFAVERHLRDQRTKASKLLASRSNYETDITQVRSRSAEVSRRLVKLRATLESLKANSDALRTAVRIERGSAETVVIAIENIAKNNRPSEGGYLSNGNTLRYSGHEVRMQDRSTHVPEEYFVRTLDELESRAHQYKGEIDEIADFLRAQGVVLSSTSGSLSKTSATQRPAGAMPGTLLDNISQRHVDMGIHGQEDLVASRGRTIEDIIRRQYEYFMVVASHIAGVSENLQSIREQFLRLIRSRDPDVLDPFQQADLREKAEKERQRMIADKRATDGSMVMAASRPQGAPLQPLAATGAFGTAGVQANGATGFGATVADGSQAKKVSGGRRKRL